MHIAEGFLPPVQAGIWFAVSAPFVIHGARQVVRLSRESTETKLLLAAAGAFTFVLSAIKLPSVTGSSSHPTGAGAGAILFKPPVMAFLCTLVLLFQALLLAHGGLTTLGSNVFSMGVAGPWAGYGCYVLLRKVKAPWWAAVAVCMAIADLATYCVTALQLAIAYPDPQTGLMGAAGKFLSVFAFTQIPLAIGEGIIGVLLFGFLRRVAAADLFRLGVLSSKEATHA